MTGHRQAGINPRPRRAFQNVVKIIIKDNADTTTPG
jgi:hypothetical protein